ncbi:hypothetical protein HAALTHF_17790n [Vreelandella aquamarina]|nr:hypothetical protein HAALTHF_17790n [Halomonas axialensis]
MEGAPVKAAREAGAEVLISLNASPYHQDKPAERLRLLELRAQEVQRPIVYVNTIGGQDELVFDGGSSCVDASGQLKVLAPYWQAGLMPIQLLQTSANTWEPQAGRSSQTSSRKRASTARW